MPVESPDQWGLMQAVRAGRARTKGISEAVAEEFILKTPKAKRKKFAKASAKKRKRKGSRRRSQWERLAEAQT